MAEINGFVHLHTHTAYSLLDGEGTVEKVLDRAKELGQEAMAITDHGNMYGVIEFYEYAKKIGEEMVPLNTIWIDWVMPIQMNDALMQAVPAAMSGEVTPEQAAEQVQNAYETLVEETGYQYDWWEDWTDEEWDSVTPKEIPEIEVK